MEMFFREAASPTAYRASIAVVRPVYDATYLSCCFTVSAIIYGRHYRRHHHQRKCLISILLWEKSLGTAAAHEILV